MLPAGKRDRRITIRTRAVAKNAKGEAIETWADLATLWAEAREPTGKEIMAGQGVNAQIDRVFVILWRSDVDQTARIAYGGDEYDIVSVGELGRQEGLMIRGVVRRVI